MCVTILPSNQPQNSSSRPKKPARAKAKLYPFIGPDGRRTWLLETPGFDDTFRSDVRVLHEIAAIFIQLRQHIKMAGIIYLHPITDVRMRGSALRNLTLLKNVCGEAAYNHLALVTTKWECFGDGDRDIALQREIELENNWWGEIRNRGSITVRHRGTADSARDVVGRVLVQYSNHGRFLLRIHEEMIVQGLKLEDTSAGKELTKDVRQVQAQYQRLLDEAEEKV
ncbi:MAG: hypothetical protein Q9198_001182 [Flavoplaca austrocitrina]